jgi:hypothetical protein
MSGAPAGGQSLVVESRSTMYPPIKPANNIASEIRNMTIPNFAVAWVAALWAAES